MRYFSRIAFVVCVSCAAVLVGCRKKAEATGRKADEAVIVTLAPSRAMSVQRTIDVVGTLFGDEEAQISAKVPGRVLKTIVDIGDRVDAGAPLAQIDPVDYELARKQAESQLQQTLSKLGLNAMPSADFNADTVPTVQQAKLQAANAEARFRRADKLFLQKPPLISEQDYADAKTNSDVAKSSYDVALLAARSLVVEAKSRIADLAVQERRLTDTAIRAPEPQTSRQYAITAKLVSTGEYVKEGSAMFRVVADNPVRFRAAVPERYLAEVKLNQSVAVRVESQKEAFDGRVRRINPQVDRESRSFEVEIELANPNGLLRPGSFARGAIATRTDSNATFVPQESIVTFAGIRKVFTVENGKAVEHEIATGVRQDNFIEIIQGLTGTPAVVMSGASKLATGTPVRLADKPSTTQTQKQ